MSFALISTINVASFKLYTVQATYNIINRTRSECKEDIAYLRQYSCDRGWLFAEAKQCIYNQNVVYVTLQVSGLGSARVNHNAEFCTFGLNQKIPPYHPTWVLHISKNTYNLCTKNKIFLTSSVYAWHIVAQSLSRLAGWFNMRSGKILSPVRRQAITRGNGDLLVIALLGLK